MLIKLKETEVKRLKVMFDTIFVIPLPLLEDILTCPTIARDGAALPQNCYFSCIEGVIGDV
jgi:hypothetical protein